MLVDRFYDKVKSDNVIGFIFKDIANVKWETHLPIMYDFWEMMLFGSGPYKGDPMTRHIELNKKIKLEPDHFDQWKKLFLETVDQNFSGKKAEEAKQRATHIANVMQFKIQQTAG